MSSGKRKMQPTALSFKAAGCCGGEVIFSEAALEKRRSEFADEIVQAAHIIDEATRIALIKSFSIVPREQFVEKSFSHLAFEDIALPVEFGGSTIRPSLLARMIGLIGPEKGVRVLLAGSGSGYSSALLAACRVRVYALESEGLLAQFSRRVLDGLSFQEVLVRTMDAGRGWKEHSPYDAVLFCYPVELISESIFNQLGEKGRVLAAVGDRKSQRLCLWERKADGSFCRYKMERCSLLESYA